MDKFIEYLKKNDVEAAMRELDTAAGYLGFHRNVPSIVDKMRNECSNQAYLFCSAIVKLLSEMNSTDVRMEECIKTARKIADSVLPENEIEASSNVLSNIRKNWIHPTTFQQLSQVAFLFFDSEGLRKKCCFDNDPWWRMPLC